MNTNKDTWVVTYKDDGTWWYTEPYEHHLAVKYASKIFDTLFWGSKIWGKEITPERRWIVAQQEYENFKEELPASHLAYYLPDANT